MLNQNLYESTLIAVPIKDDNFSDAKPNYLVINSQGGWNRDYPFEAPGSNTPIKTVCVNLHISFEKRTNWDNGQLQSLRFPILKETECFPVNYLPLMSSHQTLLDNVATVNAILGLFDFANGSQLQGFNPVLDEDVCNLIITDRAIRDDIMYLKNDSGFKTNIEVDNYLSTGNKDINIYRQYSEFNLYYGQLVYVAPIVNAAPSE